MTKVRRLELQLAHETLRAGCWEAFRARERFAFVAASGALYAVQPFAAPETSWFGTIDNDERRIGEASLQACLLGAIAFLPEPP